MRMLVTGGAGFIGHHLVRALIDQGDDVVVLDDLSTGDRRRLTAYESRIRLLIGDIRDGETVRAAVDGVEVVLHEAAVPSVARSIADPRRSNDVNVNGTVELLLAAAAAGVRRVVLAGSSSVYGSSGVLPRREDQPTDPRSPYAASKLAAEHYVHTIGAACGVESVVLRYFNVFGPGQDPLSEYAAVVPRFVTAALEGQRPVVFGDGTQSRDFTFIDNVVAANSGGSRPAGHRRKDLQHRMRWPVHAPRAARRDRGRDGAADRSGVPPGPTGRRPALAGRYLRGARASWLRTRHRVRRRDPSLGRLVRRAGG